MDYTLRSPMPSSYVEYCESLAQDLKLIPNFKELESNKELYNCLINGPLLSSHYSLNN